MQPMAERLGVTVNSSSSTPPWLRSTPSCGEERWDQLPVFRRLLAHDLGPTPLDAPGDADEGWQRGRLRGSTGVGVLR